MATTGKRAGAKRFDPGPPNVLRPQFFSLVDYADDRQVARTLRIKARLEQQLADDQHQVSLAQGLASGIPWFDSYPLVSSADRMGALRVRVGSRAGIYREITFDLRDGEFNLPPCEVIYVAAAYWNPSANSGDYLDQPLFIEAEIADGCTVESTPMVVSINFDVSENGPLHVIAKPWSTYIPAPPGAYAFDFAGGERGIVVHGSTRPDDFNDGLWAVRDPTNGVWLPPTTPILLGRHRGFHIWPIIDPAPGATWTPEIWFYVR